MAYNSKTGGDDMKLTALAGGRHKAPLRPLPAMDLPFLVLVLTLAVNGPGGSLVSELMDQKRKQGSVKRRRFQL